MKSESPNGARFLDMEHAVRTRESRPVGAQSIAGTCQPRANAPWAIESRPFGAEARLRRQKTHRPDQSLSQLRIFREIRHPKSSLHPRAGTSLVEMLAVMTVAAVMVGLAVTTMHLLLRAEREATNAARYTASIARLAHVFRDDMHFAREVELPAVEPGKPEVLTASADAGRHIRYELDAHLATRIETDGPDNTHRDVFYFPLDSRLSFEREGKDGLLRLAIEMPRVGYGTRGEPGGSSRQSMQHLAIEAASARDRRWDVTAGKAKGESE